VQRLLLRSSLENQRLAGKAKIDTKSDTKSDITGVA
jgi:hypothetical protein